MGDGSCQGIPKLQSSGTSWMWLPKESSVSGCMEIPPTLTCTKQWNRTISDFKVGTRPANVGQAAFSDRAPGFMENELLRLVCMPRWTSSSSKPGLWALLSCLAAEQAIYLSFGGSYKGLQSRTVSSGKLCIFPARILSHVAFQTQDVCSIKCSFL